jgi:hypothetical protein
MLMVGQPMLIEENGPAYGLGGGRSLVKNAQHVANENNDQYGAHSDTSAAAVAPTTMAIVPAASS